MALTKRDVDALRWNHEGPAVQILWDRGDGAVKGFGVRVYESGHRSFIVDYRIAGRKRRKRLGAYGELTVQQARKLAGNTLGGVREGKDPLELDRQERIEEQRSITFAAFAPIYIENARTRGNPGRKGLRPKKTWREDELRLQRHILPAWGKRKLTDVTRADVRRLHASIAAKYEANRVLALVSIMYRAAIHLGYLEDDYPNPAQGVSLNEEPSRDRFVSEAEMPKLMEAIEAEPNAHMRAAFLLYLLTGLRRSELCRLTWADVDLDGALLRLGETKNGDPHRLPLSAGALDVLNDTPRLLGNPFVLASPKRPGAAWHPDEVTKRWRAVRKRAGIEDVRLHDLRRTVGSWIAERGASLPQIGKILNHKSTASTAIYARIKEEAATRRHLDEHGARLTAMRKAAQRKHEKPA